MAEPHVLWLIGHSDVLCRGVAAAATSHTTIIDDDQVDSRNLAVFLHASFDPALHAGASRTYIELLFASDTQLHGSVKDARKVASNGHVRVRANLRTKAATGGFVNEYQVFQRDVQHSRKAGIVSTLALG